MKYDPALLPEVSAPVGFVFTFVAWLFLSIFSTVGCSVLGEVLEFWGAIPKGAGIFFGFVVGPSLAALFIIHRMPEVRAEVRAQRLREVLDFGWYRNTFPALVKTGRVMCAHCGGTHIGSRRRMNKQFIVEHHCHTCGEVLYFSKEQR